MQHKTSLVITSISGPNPVLAAFAEGCSRNGVDFIVAGDTKSPPDFYLAGCDFWSIERQRTLSSNLASFLPECHYARKNLAYLVAMRRGSEVIVETDDDNYPLEAFWMERKSFPPAILHEEGDWINVYSYFTDNFIWPRGFPLEVLKKPTPLLYDQEEKKTYCPIQQGLANGNPDVDAIYRLTMHLPLTFSHTASIAIGKGSWSPFNSQNTTWFNEAFPLLYIPSWCSFRMCDIWRSFVAVRICWANDWKVLFHSPTVYQKRNEHDLLMDFRDEIPGFLNNERICRELAALDIQKGTENLGENLKKCYRVFIDLGLILEKEMVLLDAWIEDVESVQCCTDPP